MDKQRIDRIGYDAEEAYFNRMNRELIQKAREQLDVDRATQVAKQSGLAHWMTCPKCGGNMKEIRVRDVYLDQCQTCQGIFFDAGELDVFVRADDSEKLSALRSQLH